MAFRSRYYYLADDLLACFMVGSAFYAGSALFARCLTSWSEANVVGLVVGGIVFALALWGAIEKCYKADR